MMMMMQVSEAWSPTFETCCGYTAALIACLAFGSFAVPIKRARLSAVPVDPLVLQSYKILMCLATSSLVVLLLPTMTTAPTSVVWTPWGIVSGLLMVPGGTAGYYAVRTAGLAVSQGIWSSLKVLVAFLWGLVIFHESVRSVPATVGGVILLMGGLLGMSWFARPTITTSLEAPLLLQEDVESLEEEVEEEEEEEEDTGSCCCSLRTYTNLSSSFFLSKRWGLLGAVVDGAYGGSILVPMHYAGVSGLAFLPSFAVGCTLVVGFVWLVRACLTRTYPHIMGPLPHMHLTTVGPSAALAGLIWSVGNLASLVAVQVLGQAIGYSLVQSQLLIAGLWGLLYYKEVKSGRAIVAWFLCCLVTVGGIILLSLQHEHPNDDDDDDDAASGTAFDHRVSSIMASAMLHV